MPSSLKIAMRPWIYAAWLGAGLSLGAGNIRADGEAGKAADSLGYVRPPLELPGLDELMVARVPSLADGLARAGADWGAATGSGRATRPVSTTVEQHATFVAFVRAFAGPPRADADPVAARERALALRNAVRPAEVLAVLLGAEAAGSGDHATALALSLAYERVGRWEEAIVWIARAVERQDEAGEQDEWLVAAILRTRLQLRDNPRWLRTHTVLDEIGPREPDEIVAAIDRQAGARARWVQAPDAVLCDLYLQAALRRPGTDVADQRAHYLRESRRYGDGLAPSVDPRPRT